MVFGEEGFAGCLCKPGFHAVDAVWVPASWSVLALLSPLGYTPQHPMLSENIREYSHTLLVNPLRQSLPFWKTDNTQTPSIILCLQFAQCGHPSCLSSPGAGGGTSPPTAVPRALSAFTLPTQYSLNSLVFRNPPHFLWLPSF